jgi:hypothetical protein
VQGKNLRGRGVHHDHRGRRSDDWTGARYSVAMGPVLR